MQRLRKRELGGMGLLFVIVGGWLFAAGFEQPWTIGHIATLVMLIVGVAICLYVLVPRQR
jgi:hypothetical protein